VKKTTVFSYGSYSIMLHRLHLLKLRTVCITTLAEASLWICGTLGADNRTSSAGVVYDAANISVNAHISMLHLYLSLHKTRMLLLSGDEKNLRTILDYDTQTHCDWACYTAVMHSSAIGKNHNDGWI